MGEFSSKKRWSLESSIFLLKYYPNETTTWTDKRIPSRAQIEGHISNLASVLGRSTDAITRMIQRIRNGGVDVTNTLSEKNLFYSQTSSEAAFEKFINNAEYLNCSDEAKILIESHSDDPKATSIGRIRLVPTDMAEAMRIVDKDTDGIKTLKTATKQAPTPAKQPTKTKVEVAEAQGQRVYKVVKQTVTETIYYYKEEDESFKSLV